MKIYTKTGDDGTDRAARQPAGCRKDDPRIESYGTVDELNAVLGLARAAGARRRRRRPARPAPGRALRSSAPRWPTPTRRAGSTTRSRPGTWAGSRPRSTRWRPSCRRSAGSSCRAATPAAAPASTWPGPSAGAPSGRSSSSVDAGRARAGAAARLPEPAERLPVRPRPGREPACGRGRRPWGGSWAMNLAARLVLITGGRRVGGALAHAPGRPGRGGRA